MIIMLIFSLYIVNMLSLNKFLIFIERNMDNTTLFSKQLYIFMNDKMRYNDHIVENTLRKHNVHYGYDNDKIRYEEWEEVC